MLGHESGGMKWTLALQYADILAISGDGECEKVVYKQISHDLDLDGEVLTGMDPAAGECGNPQDAGGGVESAASARDRRW